MQSQRTKRRDVRAWILLVLALVPTLGATYSAFSYWSSEGEHIEAVESATDPLRLSHEVQLVRATFQFAHSSLRAAALEGAGPELLQRAEADRERAWNSLHAADPRIESLSDKIAADAAISPTAFVEATTSWRNALADALARHAPGIPIDEEFTVLATTDTAFRTRFISGGGPVDTVGAFDLDLYDSLTSYRRAWWTELDLMLQRLEAPTDLAADPDRHAARRRAWGASQSAWSRVAVIDDAQLPIFGGVTADAQRFGDPADPIAEEFDSLDTASLTPAVRDRWILDALAIGDDVLADLESTQMRLVTNAEARVSNHGEARLWGAVGGAVLLGLGLGIVGLTWAEIRTRRTVQAAHEEVVAQLDRKAHRDPMTGLWNRRRMESRLSDLIASQERVGPVVLAYVDLDRFKAINDVWGHAAGDQVLSTVAGRLDAITIRGERLEVVRFGGDEFIAYAVLPNTDLAVAADLGKMINKSIAEPIEVDGRPHVITATVGLAVGDELSTADSLLLEADSALMLAKRNQRGTATIYNRQTSRAGELVRALPVAFRDREIGCAVQPIFDLGSGAFSHTEILARWHRRNGDVVGPVEFVPLVEAFGMANRLTEAMLDQVGQLQKNDLLGTSRVWLNIAPVELELNDFTNRFLEAAEERGVHLDRLGVEIIETAAIDDPVRFARDIRVLRGRGIQIAIDDFGSGYSPLGLLRELPVDVLKLDRSLISRVDEDPAQQHIVTGIINLVGVLGIRLVAEGIERPEEIAWLRERGVQYGQGFLLAEPMTPGELAARHLHIDIASGAVAVGPQATTLS